MGPRRTSRLLGMCPAPLGRIDRYRHARRIASLDARRDHVEIYRMSSGLDFPWDYQRALELALLRTFAVPAIGGLLDATGEFARSGQRRYDDTLVLMAALAKYGSWAATSDAPVIPSGPRTSSASPAAA